MSDSVESFGAVLLVSWLLSWRVSGLRGGVGVAAVRLLGVPMMILTIRRCVRRNCCLRGSVRVHVSAPYVIVGMTAPLYSRSRCRSG